jgi:hypothetical protein
MSSESGSRLEELDAKNRADDSADRCADQGSLEAWIVAAAAVTIDLGTENTTGKEAGDATDRAAGDLASDRALTTTCGLEHKHGAFRQSDRAGVHPSNRVADWLRPSRTAIGLREGAGRQQRENDDEPGDNPHIQNGNSQPV